MFGRSKAAFSPYRLEISHVIASRGPLYTLRLCHGYEAIDIADVRAQRAGLDPGDDAALVSKPNMQSIPAASQNAMISGLAVVLIAADGDVGIVPVTADMTHQAPDVGPAPSAPDGVLPGRSSIATGRPVAVSYTWIGRKQRSP